MKKVTLRQELDVLGLYLGIEQLRFGSRLTVTQTVSEEAARALVPSLLLQPLVENSLKYAISSRESGGQIRIDADVRGGQLRIDVADDGPGFAQGVIPVGGRGVGLRNTRERLAVLYAQDAALTSRNLNPGCVIELTLPAETQA
jgi:LytS/YehU family sensor histidine kinase